MKIRTQFYLMTAGIVVVPLLLFFGAYGLFKMRETKVAAVPSYEEIERYAGDSFDRDDWDQLAKYMAHRPPAIQFLVLNRERTVVFSSIEGIAAGDSLTDTDLLSHVRASSGSYFYQFDSPIRFSEDGALVVTRVSRLKSRPPSPVEWVLITLGGLLATIFAFSAFMSVTIARSITRSVTELEQATRRIAAGELDLEIATKGSNEITSLTASLNRMRLELKEDQARRARFIMGVSHDLKTPLALIKGYAEAIGDGLTDDPESRERSVQIIGDKVDQLEGMIDDLIDFVKVDTGEWRRRLDRVRLGAILASYAKRFAADAELLDRRAVVDIDLPAELAVPMDERLALRAVENLVNNALRYTAPKSSITLSARLERDCAGARAVVEVVDDGLGIDAKDLPHIFDPFYRGSASRREQGMGLGLAVVKGVADSHGWTVSVSSEKGRGSRFRIDIPIEPADLDTCGPHRDDASTGYDGDE
jgi:signal transduction histidine kinase